MEGLEHLQPPRGDRPVGLQPGGYPGRGVCKGAIRHIGHWEPSDGRNGATAWAEPGARRPEMLAKRTEGPGRGERRRKDASRSRVTPTLVPSTFPGSVFFDTNLFLRLRFPTKGTPAIYTHTQSPAVSSLPPATTPTECTDDPKPREVQPLALGHSVVQLGLESPAHLTHPPHLSLP